MCGQSAKDIVRCQHSLLTNHTEIFVLWSTLEEARDRRHLLYHTMLSGTLYSKKLCRLLNGRVRQCEKAMHTSIHDGNGAPGNVGTCSQTPDNAYTKIHAEGVHEWPTHMDVSGAVCVCVCLSSCCVYFQLMVGGRKQTTPGERSTQTTAARTSE